MKEVKTPVVHIGGKESESSPEDGSRAVKSGCHLSQVSSSTDGLRVRVDVRGLILNDLEPPAPLAPIEHPLPS